MENKGHKQKAVKNMVDIHPTVLIISLKVNGLNTPIQRHIMSEWIKKQDPSLCCLQKPTLNIKTHINGMERDAKKRCHADSNPKKAGEAALTVDGADFRARKVIRGEEGYYIMTEDSILQEDIAILTCVCI